MTNDLTSTIREAIEEATDEETGLILPFWAAVNALQAIHDAGYEINGVSAIRSALAEAYSAGSRRERDRLNEIAATLIQASQPKTEKT